MLAESVSDLGQLCLQLDFRFSHRLLQLHVHFAQLATELLRHTILYLLHSLLDFTLVRFKVLS